MASRQEEKERRKRERQEREQAEADAARRRRLAQIVGATIVTAAIIAGIVFATAGGGSDGSDGPAKTAATGAPIPQRQITDLSAAVKAAGCTMRSFPNYGQQHVSRTVTIKDFKTNPPTSGQHNPVPAQDGAYDPGNSPALENWVHALEHGRVTYQYKPGTSQRRIRQLRTLFNEPVAGGPEGFHSLLFENNTKMPFQVAAVAWRNYVGCKTFDDKAFDALRAFRDRFVDKAPEQVP